VNTLRAARLQLGQGLLEHFHKHLRCGAATFLTWAFHRACGEQPKVVLHEGKSGGVLIGVPQTQEQGRRDSGCWRRRSLAWGKWRRSSGSLTEETMQRQGPAAPKLGGRRVPVWSSAAAAWRWPTRSGLWRSSSLAEKWRSGRRRGGVALHRTTALDGSRDGVCARLDDRRRCELVRTRMGLDVGE
jgi:hypothetical protein